MAKKTRGNRNRKKTGGFPRKTVKMVAFRSPLYDMVDTKYHDDTGKKKKLQQLLKSNQVDTFFTRLLIQEEPETTKQGMIHVEEMLADILVHGNTKIHDKRVKNMNEEIEAEHAARVEKYKADKEKGPLPKRKTWEEMFQDKMLLREFYMGPGTLEEKTNEKSI